MENGFIIMGQLSSRVNKAPDKACLHEPCVLLKYNTNTAEKHHPHRLDEAPVVGAAETDGEREEQSSKSFWKWPAIHFPRRRNAKYDLVQAEEEHQCEAGIFQKLSDDGKTT